MIRGRRAGGFADYDHASEQLPPMTGSSLLLMPLTGAESPKRLNPCTQSDSLGWHPPCLARVSRPPCRRSLSCARHDKGAGVQVREFGIRAFHLWRGQLIRLSRIEASLYQTEQEALDADSVLAGASTCGVAEVYYTCICVCVCVCVFVFRLPGIPV